MWTIWRINWQIVNISVTCKIFVLTSTYLFSNILQKRLSITDIISQNCQISSLSMLTSFRWSHSPCSPSVHDCPYTVSFCTDREAQRNWCYLLVITFVHAHQTHSVNTELCEAQYSHAPHNDVSVNDGPHIGRWSHNIIILQYLPLCYNCLQYSVQ